MVIPRGLLRPADVRRLLDRHGIAPRKAAGQNFVVDPNTVRKIVRDAGVGPDDAVLEIGPGLGSLTLALAETARRVVAVEVDRGLVRALAEVVGDLPNVEVVHADALTADLDALIGDDVARLVANLPYRVATPLLFHALEATRVHDAFVMVQREVGERWAAAKGHPLYAGVSVKLAFVADVELVARVPATVFQPAPNVDSVTVRVTRRPDAPPPDEFRDLARAVDAAFATRRKTLRNSLRTALPDEVVDEVLAATRLYGGVRAEQLAPAQHRRLAEQLAPHLREDVR